MSFHPATQLLAWVGFIVAVQSMTAAALAGAAIVLLPLCLFGARSRALNLVRRSRWLLLSIMLLFAFGTPGQRLPGSLGEIGITYDGLLLASEHMMRLVLLLATLALLHERLGTSGLMAGLHWLLTPFAAWRSLRERIVVRLMLVLEYVESAPGGDWRAWLAEDPPGPDALSLAVRQVRPADWAVLALLAGLVVAFGWSP